MCILLNYNTSMKMKISFTAIVLVSVASCTFANGESSYQEEDNTNDSLKNDDEEKEFEYPCENSDDVADCVRSYFAVNSDCSVVKTWDDEPVFKKSQVTYVPKVNSSFVLGDTYLSGLNGTIEAFYINKKTNNLVMSVNFEGIILDAKKAHFIINRRSKKPKVVTDSSYGIYPVVLTAVIPVKDKIRIKDALVSAYATKKDVVYNIGRKVSESKDPDVAAVVKAINANVPTVIQEVFLTGAPDLEVRRSSEEDFLDFLAYLQKYICKFGLDELFHQC